MATTNNKLQLFDGVVKTWPRLLLRIEGACILGASVWGYWRLKQSWWTFAALLFLPDLGMVGFAVNNKTGAAIYNLVHTETPPLLLLCAAISNDHRVGIGYALTWMAHIALDRMLGFGLKYGTQFGHTHLGVLGKDA